MKRERRRECHLQGLWTLSDFLALSCIPGSPPDCLLHYQHSRGSGVKAEAFIPVCGEGGVRATPSPCPPR